MADIGIEITCDIEGLDELEAALLEGAPKMAKKFLRQVHSRAGNLLKESAEGNAPHHTGELAGDIHTQTTTSKDGMLTRVGMSRETFWGLFQEFGAPEANVTGQHWLEQSAVEVQDQVLDEYIQAVDDGLSEMKGGK